MEPGLYRVHFTENKFILLSLISGEVTVKATWPLNDYTITGPAATLQLKNFIDTVVGYMTLMNRSGALADSLKATGNTSMDGDAIKKDINTQFKTVVKRFSETTAYEPNAVIAARVLNPQEDFPFFESFNSSLDKRFAGTVMTREFHQFFERLKEGMPEPNEIGNKAPELKLEDTNGKVISLSSLQGKYVLLDFWASWCGPCRAENPNVLTAYKKFKNKNFTILAVSLDNNKAKWIDAVRHDALLWWQVSDLKGWQSPAAAKYGVRGIPMNFLIDPKGVIIAKNLRGPALEEKLGETLK
jgi:peroxiredoxin